MQCFSIYVSSWNPAKWRICHEVIFFVIPSSRLNSLSPYPAYHLEGQSEHPRIMTLHDHLHDVVCLSTNTSHQQLKLTVTRSWAIRAWAVRKGAPISFLYITNYCSPVASLPRLGRTTIKASSLRPSASVEPSHLLVPKLSCTSAQQNKKYGKIGIPVVLKAHSLSEK